LSFAIGGPPGLNLPESNSGVGAIRRAQFVPRIGYVTGNRVGAQCQPISNGAICHSLTDHLNDLDFPIRQSSSSCTTREESVGEFGDWTRLARNLLQQATAVACTEPS